MSPLVSAGLDRPVAEVETVAVTSGDGLHAVYFDRDTYCFFQNIRDSLGRTARRSSHEARATVWL
jgi:hypothetical protein